MRRLSKANAVLPAVLASITMGFAQTLSETEAGTHGQQPIIASLLPVNRSHILSGMPHDVVDGRRIANFIGNRAECMP